MTQSIDPASTAPWPADPIAATTHPDPYPYYAWLAAERPLYRDQGLALWVAAGAGAVASVLASELCQAFGRPKRSGSPETASSGCPAGAGRGSIRSARGEAAGVTIGNQALPRRA